MTPWYITTNPTTVRALALLTVVLLLIGLNIILMYGRPTRSEKLYFSTLFILSIVYVTFRGIIQ